MKEKLHKLMCLFDEKLCDIDHNIRELGWRTYVRDPFWDKKDKKILIENKDINKYERIMKDLSDLVMEGNEHYFRMRRYIQESIKYLRALRDQYRPPYDCSWFSDYSGDWVSGNKVKDNVASLLCDLLGNDRVHNIKNTHVKFIRQGNLVVQFGIIKTPKTIVFSLPGIIDVYKEHRLGFDEEEYDPELISEYIPSFAILFDTGLGAKKINVSHDMTQFDLFKKDLINMFDYDVNKSIPKKPELDGSMSYEDFIDWKINRIANINIDS